MNNQTRSLIEIHIAVFLFGFSGILNKLITLPAGVIVCLRTFIACFVLVVMIGLARKSLSVRKPREYAVFLFLGLLAVIHWTAFTHATQIATVGVGMLTYCISPLFVTFLEPVFFKERLKKQSVGIALITVCGILLIIPTFSLSNTITVGVLFSCLAAFAYALLSVLNRKYVKQYSSIQLTFYQYAFASMILLPVVVVQQPVFTFDSIIYLLYLGIFSTAVAHTYYINGMKHVKAHSASIIQTLEPVYGVLLAAFVLYEQPTAREIIGGLIVLGSAVYITHSAKAVRSMTPVSTGPTNSERNLALVKERV